MTLFSLFWTFFYIGLFTVGGGQVAITLMQQSLVDKGIISPEKFFNMVAISESTPGPIGINMATYIGCELYGVWGGIITTVGTVLPSLICIILIASFFGRIQDKPLVKSAFKGIRPVVAGLIGVAAWNVFKLSMLNFDAFHKTGNFFSLFYLPSVIFYSISVFVMIKIKLHPLIMMILGAVFGIIFL